MNKLYFSNHNMYNNWPYNFTFNVLSIKINNAK